MEMEGIDMVQRFHRFLFQPCLPLGKDGRRASACEEHIALSRRAATEGMVLLKNENNTLPLTKGKTIALFGSHCVKYQKGGGGSGEVFPPYVRNLCDGMKIKEEEGKLKVFRPLCDFYETYVKNRQAILDKRWDSDWQAAESIEYEPDREREHAKIVFQHQIGEPDIPDNLFSEAVKSADVAVIMIGRFSSENYDRSAEKGDFYLTDDETDLVEKVSNAFEKVIVVLNVGGMIDTMCFSQNEKIGGMLLAWQCGMEGGLAIADVLCGDVNPSGKLTDTFAKTFDDYPSSPNFNESDDYVDYNEDIYVGYRYFETIPGAKEKVNYPFGFGLSYTTFELTEKNAYDDGKRITVTITVMNTGALAGKEVVQVYYSAAQGVLGKPRKELVAFQKTKLLQPGESQTVTLNFAIDDMASYDDLGKLQKAAYLLEQGKYSIYVGTSVVDCEELTYHYVVEESYRVTKQLQSRCVSIALKERMLADGTMEKLPQGELILHYPIPQGNIAAAPEKTVLLEAVGKEANLDEFLAQFTDEELCRFVGGSADIGVSNTQCFGGLERLGIPKFPTTDGPAGVRIRPGCGVSTTAWPCATLLACTWEPKLLYEIGAAGALEVKENNLAVWLTPGMNIHRSPLCGRNFEYYSEDPLISGKMAAAMVNGIQSQGIGASAKHLVANNKEINRAFSDSRVSERALREIYLKGFEICVKESQPWTVMTSYNLMNGVHTSENYELLVNILREEWGFEGMVTTDWYRKNNPVNEVRAGNDIKMGYGYPEELEEALKEGRLTRAHLECCVRNILKLMLRFD